MTVTTYINHGISIVKFWFHKSKEMQAVLYLCLLLSVAVSIGFAQDLVCPMEALAFRAEPNTQSYIYGTLFPGYCFKSLHEEADGSGYHWAKVAFDGQVGWVVKYAFKYVTTNEVTFCTCAKVDSVNLYASHTPDSHVLNVLQPWNCGRKISQATNWILIDFHQQTGWVSAFETRTIYCG
ncbi:hypothetical protein CHS0354_036189 [Potamilus streckersoni]|uniref:SH3b domain-containing protein n=1 Tax=Potamilus streckersoni TaxID=2493646 RepID=A0AAE0SVW3_9BIVA|nr:hypothetical protein CHS0354_036189 [Potamilus streckersoni]